MFAPADAAAVCTICEMAAWLPRLKVPACDALASVMAVANALFTALEASSKLVDVLEASMVPDTCVMMLATCSATACVDSAVAFCASLAVLLDSTANGS